MNFEWVNTKAAMLASTRADNRMIFVLADESIGGVLGIYIYVNGIFTQITTK